MRKIAFFDTKPYDKHFFDKQNKNYEINYFTEKLGEETAHLAKGAEAVVAFVNDVLDAKTIDILYKLGVKVVALRCAGYNNIDVKAAYEKLYIVRVPAYSPYAVAEHAMALMLSLNRKIHKSFNRTRDFNFSLNGLTGFDMYKKTIGVIGTGRIGKIFINICKGFGMNVLAYDPYPTEIEGVTYVELDELLANADMISVHVPLNKATYHLINKKTIKKMKDGVYFVNTSRGGLVDSAALLEGLNNGKIKAAGLDVYEEETELFFEDYSNETIKDDTLKLLLAESNVIITSHQAFLTQEALSNIAEVTLGNLDQFFAEGPLDNEVCYLCNDGPNAYECRAKRDGRCF
jgi:D-lactate dehydrogenase